MEPELIGSLHYIFRNPRPHAVIRNRVFHAEWNTYGIYFGPKAANKAGRKTTEVSIAIDTPKVPPIPSDGAPVFSKKVDLEVLLQLSILRKNRLGLL